MLIAIPSGRTLTTYRLLLPVPEKTYEVKFANLRFARVTTTPAAI